MRLVPARGGFDSADKPIDRPDAGLNRGNFRRTWAQFGELCQSPVYFEGLVDLTRFAAAIVLFGVPELVRNPIRKAFEEPS